MRTPPDPFAPAIALLLASALVFAYVHESVPADQANLCRVFEQHPRWYDDARAAAAEWDIPIPTLMAFVQRESSFRRDVRPPRSTLWGWLPWRRPSSAFGYGQIQDPVWGEYLADRGGLRRSREHMADVLDFIGWYNRETIERLGIDRDNVEHLYLAYHQGRAGYASGRWRRREGVRRYAKTVARRAADYARQLEACEARFRCDGWLEFWPFCTTEASASGPPPTS